jgi:hypothetical protein
MPLILERLRSNPKKNNGLLANGTNGEADTHNGNKMISPQSQKSKDLLQRIHSLNKSPPNNEEEKQISLGNTLQQSSFQSILGCFQLLSDLTTYSTELFQDLSYSIASSNTRILLLSKKIHNLHELEIEKRIKQSSLAVTPSGENGVEEEGEKDIHTTRQSTRISTLIPSNFQSKPYPFTSSLLDHRKLSSSFLRNLTKLQKNPNFLVFYDYLPYFSKGKGRLSSEGGNLSSIKGHSEESKETPSALVSPTGGGTKDQSQKNVKIGVSYSYPQFFLNQWLYQQEKRLEYQEIERKQLKNDRKKREKVKQKAVDDDRNRRKSEIQVIRWQDRYTGDGRSVRSGAGSTRRFTGRSLYGVGSSRRSMLKSFNFDEEELDDHSSKKDSGKERESVLSPSSSSAATATTKVVPPPPPPSVLSPLPPPPGGVFSPPAPSLSQLQHKEEAALKELNPDVTIVGMLPTKESGQLSDKSNEADTSPKQSQQSSSLSSIFPTLATRSSEDEDSDDDGGKGAIVNKNDISMISNDSADTDVTNLSKSRSMDYNDEGVEKVKIEREKTSTKKPPPLKEEDILFKIKEDLTSSSFKVDLNDPTLFISPIPFVINEEVVSSLSSANRASVRISMNFRNLYPDQCLTLVDQSNPNIVTTSSTLNDTLPPSVIPPSNNRNSIPSTSSGSSPFIPGQTGMTRSTVPSSASSLSSISKSDSNNPVGSNGSSNNGSNDNNETTKSLPLPEKDLIPSSLSSSLGAKARPPPPPPPLPILKKDTSIAIASDITASTNNTNRTAAEKRVSFSAASPRPPPPPPPIFTKRSESETSNSLGTVGSDQVVLPLSDENNGNLRDKISPLGRQLNDKRLVTKSVRLQGGLTNFADILSAAPKPKPPPPPPKITPPEIADRTISLPLNTVNTPEPAASIPEEETKPTRPSIFTDVDDTDLMIQSSTGFPLFIPPPAPSPTVSSLTTTPVPTPGQRLSTDVRNFFVFSRFLLNSSLSSALLFNFVLSF